MAALQDLLGQFTRAQQQARQANIARAEEGRGIWEQITEQYKPGGAFMQGALGRYEGQKRRDIAGQRQSLVSSGLFGTSVSAGLPSKYEAQVGTPFRAQLEERRMGQYTGALAGKERFLSSIQERGPDPGLVASLMEKIGQAPTGTRPPVFQQSSPTSMYSRLKSSMSYSALKNR